MTTQSISRLEYGDELRDAWEAFHADEDEYGDALAEWFSGGCKTEAPPSPPKAETDIEELLAYFNCGAGWGERAAA